uniref:Uncharacterized protein n=1 Tax=Aegilops tauschii subsp. strangulata TaxID=200361 RepID=A0A453AW82_AEGTS
MITTLDNSIQGITLHRKKWIAFLDHCFFFQRVILNFLRVYTDKRTSFSISLIIKSRSSSSCSSSPLLAGRAWSNFNNSLWLSTKT